MRTFSDLSEAVRFLASALESDDPASLAEACREPLPQGWVLDRLRERNAATPLTELYAGRQFPLWGNELKLGGHDSELGHIHIDFVRSGDGRWEIKRIWMCR